MSLYELLHEEVKFIINYPDREIRVYENDCCPETLATLKDLPRGITWEEIGLTYHELKRDDLPAIVIDSMILDKKKLVERLYEFYISKK